MVIVRESCFRWEGVTSTRTADTLLRCRPWNSVPHGYVQYLSHIIPPTSSRSHPVTTGFFTVVRAKQQTTTHTSGRGHIRSEEEDSARTSSCRSKIGMRRFRESVAPAGVIHDIDFIFLAIGRLIRSTIGCPPEPPSAAPGQPRSWVLVGCGRF